MLFFGLPNNASTVTTDVSREFSNFPATREKGNEECESREGRGRGRWAAWAFALVVEGRGAPP